MTDFNQLRLDSEYERMWLCPRELHGRPPSPDQLGALERHITLTQYQWEHHMMMEIGVPLKAIAPCIQCEKCGRYPEPRIITRIFIEESHEWELRSTEDLTRDDCLLEDQ